MLQKLLTTHRINMSILRKMNIEFKDRLLKKVHKNINYLRRGRRKTARRKIFPVRYIDQINNITRITDPDIMKKVEDCYHEEVTTFYSETKKATKIIINQCLKIIDLTTCKMICFKNKDIFLIIFFRFFFY